MEDLKSIGRYTSGKWGRMQRNSYLAILDNSFHVISKHPDLGMICDYIKPGYRKYHAGRHLVFYRKGIEQIEIIRILHDSMNIESSF